MTLSLFIFEAKIKEGCYTIDSKYSYIGNDLMCDSFLGRAEVPTLRK